MKKFFIMALLAAFSLSTQAQIVRSTTSMVYKEKKQRNFMWTVRLDGSSDTYTGNSDMKSAIGFDGALGFTKYANSEGRRDGFFWGAEAVCMTNSGKWEPVSETFAFGVYGAPRVGYKVPIIDNIAIAPYVGGYVGYMFESDRKREQKETVLNSTQRLVNYYEFKPGECVSFGFTIGAEIFLSKSFFIDMHIRKSLAEDGETETYSDLVTTTNVTDKWGNTTERTNYNHQPDVKDKISGFKFSIGCGFQF